MNNVILCGNITADPRTKETSKGKVANYTIAVSKYLGRGRKGVDYIPLVAFGFAAEWAEKYVKKGMKLLIQGELHSDSYKSKEGKTIDKLYVTVAKHEFVGANKNELDKDLASVEDTAFINVTADEEYTPFNA